MIDRSNKRFTSAVENGNVREVSELIDAGFCDVNRCKDNYGNPDIKRLPLFISLSNIKRENDAFFSNFEVPFEP